MIKKTSISKIPLMVLLGLFFNYAEAQPAPTGNDCADVNASVTQTFNSWMQASVPKQDPSTFNQANYDIAGIMSQDVASGFSKLMSVNFSGLAQSLLDKGLTAAASKGASAFGAQINGILGQYGVGGVSFETTANSTSMTYTPSSTVQSAVNLLGNPATIVPMIAPATTSIYSRLIP